MSALRHTSDAKRVLLELYTRLFCSFGNRHWWPADGAEEVVIGAILAQNTAWKNVAQAIAALKTSGMLSFKALHQADSRQLAELIRPARFNNQKTQALKAFAGYCGRRYGYSLTRMRRQPLAVLRGELLSLYRIGPETADSILLYALEKPVFVIDAYTRRILSRHGLLGAQDTYDACQHFFMSILPPDVEFFNEYHALLVHAGNLFCKPEPRCAGCPLDGFNVRRKSMRAG